MPPPSHRSRIPLCAALAVATGIALAAAGDVARAQTCTSGPRIPFAGHNLPLVSQAAPGALDVVPVYPSVPLEQPLFLASPPDGTGRLFVVEKTGRIRILPSDPSGSTSTVFLDLSSEVGTAVEQGLLGLAFDPDYATNRRFYVDFIALSSTCQSGNACTRLVRFLASASNPDQADPASRVDLLEIPRSNNHHNGGMLAFGRDGMLYISQGEDGQASNAQDLSTLLGKILRIDVRGAFYAVPPDNPFVGQAGIRPEIWAYGMRNPWRFSFDRLTGDLWIADVGEDSWEEIDYLPVGNGGGSNFGWPYCEGTHDAQGPGSCASIASVPPLLEYPHDQTGGSNVTGGYVYRGDRLPSIYGSYLYVDFGSGTLWARPTLAGPSVVVANQQQIAGFGEGSDGELYLVSIAGGLFRLQEPINSGTQEFPTTLSATGLFSNVAALTPAPGLVEYDVSSPLWSDRAVKRRWIALPGTERVQFTASGAWTFPVGTAFVKHFELPLTPTTLRRVETRVLLRQVDRWVGYTYRWNAAQTDATLLTAGASDVFTVNMGGGPTQQTWKYPAPVECLGCHTPAAGRVLGVRTVQLNRNFGFTGGSDNQLHAWGSCMGLFQQAIASPSTYGSLADPANTAEPIGARARSYLDANCSHCHQPFGPAPGGLDLRHTPLLSAMNLIGVTPTSGELGVVGAQRIHVGSKEQSVLWQRVQSSDLAIHMPRGAQLPDPLAVSLIGSWIDTGLAVLDSDFDSLSDATDNCPYEPNATQIDGGGWLSSVPDGSGDACQCGNVRVNGSVGGPDMLQLRMHLTGRTTGTLPGIERRLSFTDAAGNPSILDLTRFRRSLAGVDPPLAQTCPAATQLSP